MSGAISVKLLDGQIIDFDYSSDAPLSVDALYQSVSDRVDTPAVDISLMYCGRTLESGRSCADYVIHPRTGSSAVLYQVLLRGRDWPPINVSRSLLYNLSKRTDLFPVSTRTLTGATVTIQVAGDTTVKVARVLFGLAFAHTYNAHQYFGPAVLVFNAKQLRDDQTLVSGEW